MNFNITDTITEEDRQTVYQGLLDYNLSKLEGNLPQDLGIYCEDESGKKIAGLLAKTHENWMAIEYLWVAPEQRGNKIGSQLLQQAEETARKRGCQYSFLNTFDFQAPLFYKKYGYKEVFVLEDYPKTGKRYYLIKTL